jgi:hypothetical protein
MYQKSYMWWEQDNRTLGKEVVQSRKHLKVGQIRIKNQGRNRQTKRQPDFHHNQEYR